MATGLNSPNGIAFHNGTLYIAEINKISKIDNIESQLDNPPKPTVIYSDLPNDAPHGWKFLTVGPDNKLYFNIGAPCNICMPPRRTPRSAASISMAAGWKSSRAASARSSAWTGTRSRSSCISPKTSVTGCPRIEPNDKLNRVAHPGKDNFGFPYCDGGDMPDPNSAGATAATSSPSRWRSSGRTQRRSACASIPAACSRPNIATPLFMPATARGTKSKKFGGDIVVAKLNADGTVKSVEPFITGFLQDNKYVGRPVDLELMKDGSMLISDDWNGAVYRLTYGVPRVSSRR